MKTEKPNHIGIVLNATMEEIAAKIKGEMSKASYEEATDSLAKANGYCITAEYRDGYVVLGKYKTRAAAKSALPKVKRDYLKEIKYAFIRKEGK